MKFPASIISGLVLLLFSHVVSAGGQSCTKAYVDKIASIHCKRLLSGRDERYELAGRACGGGWFPQDWGAMTVETVFSTIPGIIGGAMVGGGEGVLAGQYAAVGLWAGPAVFVGMVGARESVLGVKESRYKKVVHVLDELHDPAARSEGRHLKKLFTIVTGLDPKLYAESYESYLKFLDYTEEREYLCRDRLFTYHDFKSWLREAWVPYKHDWLM